MRVALRFLSVFVVVLNACARPDEPPTARVQSPALVADVLPVSQTIVEGGEARFFGEVRLTSPTNGRPTRAGWDFTSDGVLDSISCDDAGGVPCATFAQSSIYASGATSVGFATEFETGDLDGDGDLDVVVQGVSELLVLLNRGGRLVSAGRYPIPAFNDAIALGDFDADGALDVVHNSFTGLFVSRGRGDGSFEAATELPPLLPAAGVSALELADLSGDGRLDIVTAHFSANSLTVLRVDAAGGFLPVSTISTVSNPRQILVANLDASPDLEVFVAGTDIGGVHANDGNGNLSPHVPYFLGNQAGRVALGDLDADGALDLVSPLENASSPGLDVKLGDGAGGFGPSTYVAGQSGLAAAIADVGNDGTADVVVAAEFAGSIAIFRGDGSGALVGERMFGLGGQGARVVVADFSGTGGLPDVLALVPGRESVVLLEGAANGSFGPAAHVPVGTRASDAELADLDGDGDLDLVAAADGPESRLEVRLNAGGGAFGAPAFYATAMPPEDVAVGDLDADGDPDVVVALQNGVVARRLGVGAGVFGTSGSFGFGASHTHTQSIALGHFNADPHLDAAVVYATFSAQRIGVLLGDGAGGLVPAGSVAALSPYRIGVADFDGDGLDDIATTDSSNQTLRIDLSDGAGGLITLPAVPLPAAAYAFAIGDLDGDSDPDVVTGSGSGARLDFLANDGTAGFSLAGTSPAVASAWVMATADVDGDGAQDVVMLSTIVSTVEVFLGNGAGGFPTRMWTQGPVGADSAAFGDVDGDGRPDLVVAGNESASASIYTNLGRVWTIPAAASAVYPDNGAFTATFEVTSTTGIFAAPVSVTVTDSAPSISPIFVNSAVEGTDTFLAADVLSQGDAIVGCTWSFSDGTPDVDDPTCIFGNATVAHRFADGDPTDYTVTLTVQDEDSSASRSETVTIQNGPPFPYVEVAGGATEGEVVTLTLQVLDGSDPFWNVSLDFLMLSTSMVVSSQGPFQFERTLTEGGSWTLYAVAVDETDAAGQPTAGSLMGENVLFFEIAEALPAVGPITTQGSLEEGAAITFSASLQSSVHDAVQSCTWQFGDGTGITDTSCAGSGNTIASITHTYEDGDPTARTVTLTIRDEDGDVTTVLPITVGNAAPSVSITTDSPRPEGSTTTATIAIDDGLADDGYYRVQLDWGDGASETRILAADGPVAAAHAYADDGSYSVAATVLDQADVAGAATAGSLVGTGTVAANVTNEAPVVLPLAAQSATEGDVFLVAVIASDAAGPRDPLAYALSQAPSGMSIAANGTIGWVPGYSQSAAAPGMAHSVTVVVNDGDGGMTPVSFVVRATWADDDGDGMADTWEIANGLDPTVNDANADADGDGVSNLQEFQNGTPAGGGGGSGGSGAPGTPVVSAPASGASVTVNDPPFRISSGGGASAASYALVLATNDTFSNPIGSFSVVATTGEMLVVVDDLTDDAGNGDDDGANPRDAELADDRVYWLRVRAQAADGTQSAWTEPRSFFYDPVNDPPSAPALGSPLDATEVTTLSPILHASFVPEVDDEVLVSFELHDDAAAAGPPIASSGPLAQAGGGTLWAAPLQLADGTTYWWRAIARDTRGAAATSSLWSFTVNLANDAPSAPVVFGPTDGEVVQSTTPSLEVANATDADGDALTYRFELCDSPAFAGPGLQVVTGVAPGATHTSWTPAALVENTTYWWRVRAFDGAAAGDWTTATFSVDATNEAPTTSTFLSIADGDSRLDPISVVTFVAGRDPEGGDVDYSLTVSREGTNVGLATGLVPGGSVVSAAISSIVTQPGTYVFELVVTDELGLPSPPTTATVTIRKSPGGGGGGGCVVGPRTRGMPLAPVMALALAMALRRRRR